MAADGRGYPLGLKGQEIPLYARIISVADTYGAMTSDRAYRRALPHSVAVREIGRCSGTQIDLDIAEDCKQIIEEDLQWFKNTRDRRLQAAGEAFEDSEQHTDLERVIAGVEEVVELLNS